ncbi:MULTISPECIES: Hcp family type VI secretion system effector [Gammaproteobacteria]|jgi:type VI secretion system secreted protein Hcp|uniref:Hemolysin D n=2 Tax=Halomonadaceae TaxID=28256 RepID=A0A2A2FBE5_9GAMM|nr:MULTISPECIES: type VI secretion system tube protein Hcp [Gammaproteobacteria]KAA8982802.1 type VI secretion system tube protein Hcp [Halospina sp. K52047b]MYL26034.1 Hcp1 family type VI secretion system effector [Halomonas utahensis]MYL73404.1 Hcp1 family type VI secretion system effector [Halomonas sp. 22501_18_FS]PAU82150.1 hemolysin D [Halovibrio salipaludis]
MQTNTYLDFGGLKGEATAEEYKDLITVDTLDFNVHRDIAAPTGTAMDREASATRLGDITITKKQDKATPDLFKEATIGKGKPATFYLTKQGDKIEEIMKIELSDAMISNYSVSAEGDRPTESITISYTEMTMSVTPTDDTNAATAPLVYGYSGVKGQQL